MTADSGSDDVLVELAGYLDARAGAAERARLGQLAQLLLPRLPPEDVRGRTPADLYGMLRTVHRCIRLRGADTPIVHLLNPENLQTLLLRLRAVAEQGNANGGAGNAEGAL